MRPPASSTSFYYEALQCRVYIQNECIYTYKYFQLKPAVSHILNIRKINGYVPWKWLGMHHLHVMYVLHSNMDIFALVIDRKSHSSLYVACLNIHHIYIFFGYSYMTSNMRILILSPNKHDIFILKKNMQRTNLWVLLYDVRAANIENMYTNIYAQPSAWHSKLRVVRHVILCMFAKLRTMIFICLVLYSRWCIFDYIFK